MGEDEKRRSELQNLYSSVRIPTGASSQRSSRAGGWTVWIIPSWAIGTAFIIVVIAAANVVARRLIGSADKSAGRNPTEPDVARLTQALDDVQRRLGELEERMA